MRYIHNSGISSLKISNSLLIVLPVLLLLEACGETSTPATQTITTSSTTSTPIATSLTQPTTTAATTTVLPTTAAALPSVATSINPVTTTPATSISNVTTAAAQTSTNATALPTGVAAKDLSFDFGDGWVAQGQITYPAGKSGPFPTVMLVHGSGNNDMDETLPESASQIPGGSKFFLPIADYLPTRGFAVVRYNKRGVIGIGPQVSPNITKIVGMTKPDTQYAQDASFVLQQTLKNELVDPKRVVMLGHSEGTLNVSHVATSPAGKDVAGVVLMGVQGYDIKTFLQYQLVDRDIMFLGQDADTNKDGKVSVDEFLTWANQLSGGYRAAYLKGYLIPDSSPAKYKFNPGLDKNGDGLLDLQNELRPVLQASSGIDNFPNIPALGGQKNAAGLADWEKNGGVVTVLPAYKGSVLLMNGEADTQLPVQSARDTEAALTKAGNSDHTLKTYPGLGHTFYPAKGLDQPLGPPQNKVLQNLGDWLSQRFLKQ